MPNTGVMIHARRPPTGGGAGILCGSEPEACCFDFIDMTAVILDTGTPANNFTGNPNDLLTYVSETDTGSTPDIKWIFTANNLWESGTGLRTSYDTGAPGTALGVKIEREKFNPVEMSNDLTDASWITSNMGVTFNATGPDGVSNSASTLTANAANATVKQSVADPLGISWTTGIFLKRRTGTGNIDITDDDGVSWETLTIDSTWKRYTGAVFFTGTSWIIGLRIVTSGDEVDVWGFESQGNIVAGTNPLTSPMPSIGPRGTGDTGPHRGDDDIQLAMSATPIPDCTTSGDEVTIYCEVLAGSWYATSQPAVISLDDGKTFPSDSIRLGMISNAFVGVADGAVGDQGACFGTVLFDRARHKWALSWGEDDMRLVVDGDTGGGPFAQTDQTCDLMTNPLTVMRFGRASLDTHWVGPIARLSIFPRKFTKAEMITLTTL